MANKVAVLMGGWSVEREISLISGATVTEALRARGFDATAIDVDRKVSRALTSLEPDIVFNALHGRFGEDGSIQGMLETMELRYTHSGVLASAMAMDKPASRTLFAAAGLRCPTGQVVRRDEFLKRRRSIDPPYVVKPTNEGSSVGVLIVWDDAGQALDAEAEYGEHVLVEHYVPGIELSVAVRDGEPLGVIKIEPAQGFYDYKAKYNDGGSIHTMPAPIPSSVYRRCMDTAAVAHRCLGCRGVTRADLRWDTTEGDDGLYLLEINTQAGMTPKSLVPEIAAHVGIDFGALVEWMVNDAGCGR